MIAMIKLTLPNLLTLLRILLIPFLVACYYIPFAWAPIATAIIFVIAALTDWLDGLFARLLNQTSPFGRFLDPVADKLIVVTALILLVSDPKLPYIMIPVLVIVGREIAVSALREWMAEIGKRASLAVSFLGKFKTFLQMLAIIVLLATREGNEFLLLVTGYALIYTAALMTLWSMYMYIKIAWPDLTTPRDVAEEEAS